MKKGTRGLLIIGLLAVIFGLTGLTKNRTVESKAAYGNETVRVYLDKKYAIENGLGWWQTDETWIHIWDGQNTYKKMTKMSNYLFYYDVPGSVWTNFTDNSRGIEMYVYDRSSPQNQTDFTGGVYLKNNEYNYFIVKTANGGAKQETDKKNYEVEQVVTAIHGLSCSSMAMTVEMAVYQYNNLRPKGKTEIQTWKINGDPNEVTMYQRLVYLANYHNVPLSGVRYTASDESKKDYMAIFTIGTLGFVTIGGYALLKKKKMI